MHAIHHGATSVFVCNHLRCRTATGRPGPSARSSSSSSSSSSCCSILSPQSSTCCSIPTNQTWVNSPFFSFSTSLPDLHSWQLGLINTFIKASPKSTKCNQTPTLLLSLHTSTSHTLPSCKYWSLQGHFSCEDIGGMFCFAQ